MTEAKTTETIFLKESKCKTSNVGFSPDRCLQLNPANTKVSDLILVSGFEAEFLHRMGICRFGTCR